MVGEQQVDLRSHARRAREARRRHGTRAEACDARCRRADLRVDLTGWAQGCFRRLAPVAPGLRRGVVRGLRALPWRPHSRQDAEVHERRGTCRLVAERQDARVRIPRCADLLARRRKGALGDAGNGLARRPGRCATRLAATLIPGVSPGRRSYLCQTSLTLLDVSRIFPDTSLSDT